MLLKIESGISGGIAKISHRHSKATNEYMGTEFDPAEELITFMVGQRRNNFESLDLSGWPMMNLMIANICVVSLKLI